MTSEIFGGIPWAGALGGTDATKLSRESGGMQRNCHVNLAARSAGDFWWTPWGPAPGARRPVA